MSIGRRSPGRSTAQPSVRPSHTHNDAAARTALSSASSSAGAGGIHHDQRGGVELRDQPALEHLAVASHGRPVDARGGCTLPVRAQAVDLELGGGGVEPPPREARLRAHPSLCTGARAAAAGSGDRLDPRKHEHLLAAVALDLAREEPQRVADHEQLGLEHAPSAPREAHVDAQAARPATGHRHRPAEQRFEQLASGRGQHTALHLHPQRVGLVLHDRVRTGHARDRGAPRGQQDPGDGAERQHHEAHPGHVQRSHVERSPGQAQRHSEQRREEWPQHQPVRAREPVPARRGRPRPARRHRCRARAASGG